MPSYRKLAAHQEKSVRKNNENSDSRVCVLFYVGWLHACIEVAAPKEPITINMNVKIEHEIIIKADKDVEDLLKTRSDLF